MALSYLIHPERALVVITRRQAVGADEWESFLSSFLEDPAFERGFAIVEDRRALTELPSRVEVERTARWIQDHAEALGPTRWAIVVSAASPAAFGMARVREALTSGGPVRVRPFTDYEAALAWAQQVGDGV